MESLVVAATAFVLIVPVELPDKTFIATLVLGTRYPPLPAWLGMVAAFGVQSAVAAGAGHLIARLPERPVGLVADSPPCRCSSARGRRWRWCPGWPYCSAAGS